MQGYSQNLKDWNYGTYIGIGNIVKGHTITGKDDTGNTVILEDCFIATINSSSLEKSEYGYFFSIEIYIENLRILYSEITEGTSEKIHFDWFICDEITAHFSNITFRKKNQSIPKIRVGIDNYDNSIQNMIGSSSSKDYVQISFGEHKCIIAKVPAIFMHDCLTGICFEFRGTEIENVTKEEKDSLKDFLSFIFGTKLIFIGYSLTTRNILTEAYGTSVFISSLKHTVQKTIPPIKFNLQYEWGHIEWLVKQLFPFYLKLKGPLQLDQVIARYFISREIPIGANLPVLSNAIEILAEKYLKMEGEININYLTYDEFLDLINEEFLAIKQKLNGIEGSEIMLNKIKSVNKRNPSEKISFFFSIIGIFTGESEKKAIALRNKMVHSSRNYNKQETIYNDLMLTRIYQVLFNRIVLKLLGYTGYYIDYSMTGSPLKHIDKCAGVK